jgi:hypothetical protein
MYSKIYKVYGEFVDIMKDLISKIQPSVAGKKIRFLNWRNSKCRKKNAKFSQKRP